MSLIAVDGAHMEPIWGWQDPGGTQVGPINFAIWGIMLKMLWFQQHIHN